MPHRWCNSAILRRNQIESGLDLTFNDVFKPYFFNKIEKISPKSILEVGSGTGHLSKELVILCDDITAIEPSKGMYDISLDVLNGLKVNTINCTSFELNKNSEFELAFSHLVAHVVEDLSSFLISVREHLQVGGHFIFSIPHPCFYNDYKKMFGSEYRYMKDSFKNISFSITKDNLNLITDVPYHHRPLSSYINKIVESGFNIDGFDEIYPSEEIQNKYGKAWLSPRYCVFMCKKL